MVDLARRLELGEVISVDGSSAGKKYDVYKKGEAYL
jgi:hypothetical protein